MATRFSANAQSYTATLSAGVITNRTFAGWFKISVDRNAISGFFGVDTGTHGAGDYAQIKTAVDGTTINLDDTLVTGTGIALTAGTWYYVALSSAGTASTLYTRALTATAWTTSASTGDGSIDCALFTIADDIFTGTTGFLNGCVAAIKVWMGKALTQAELEEEMWQYVPACTTNLVGWYPLITPETADYSGSGHDLTAAGAGAVQEDGPGISWSGGPVSPQIFTSAAAAAVLEPSVPRSFAPLIRAGYW